MFGSNTTSWMYKPNTPGSSTFPGECYIYSSVTKFGPVTGSNASSGGKGIADPPHAELFPSWPASSPWVTAVGATRFAGQLVGNEEVVCDQFGSGGGFSSMFSQDDAPWQKEAVAKYVSQGPTLPKWPKKSMFDPNGRATPDVAALGEGYQVFVQSGIQSVGGTSASSPAFAGLISLINEARLQAGSPPMGFLNPFLYKNADAFFDVVKGTNAHPRGPGDTPYGYAAAEGWDAATGLGTPHFDKLLSAALKAAALSTAPPASVSHCYLCKVAVGRCRWDVTTTVCATDDDCRKAFPSVPAECVQDGGKPAEAQL